jgi:amino acid permease
MSTTDRDDVALSGAADGVVTAPQSPTVVEPACGLDATPVVPVTVTAAPPVILPHMLLEEAPSAAFAPTNVPDTSPARAAVHIFKSYVGMAMFMLPTATNDVGYVAGPVLSVIASFIVADTTHMLINAKMKIRAVDPEVRTFPQVAGFVFGAPAAKIVDVAIAVTQLTWCLLYIQISGGVLSEVAESPQTYVIFVILASLFTLPMTLFSNNLSVLAIASAGSTVCVSVVICTTVGSMVTALSEDGVGPGVTPFGDVTRWGSFISLDFSVLAGIAVMLPIQNAMSLDHQERVFPRLFTGMISFISVLYIFYGFTGYLAYGSRLTSSIVSVLPVSPYGTFVRVMLAFNVMLTFPIQFVPAIAIIDGVFGIPANIHVLKHRSAVLLRVGVCAFILVVALLIGAATAGAVASLVGASCVAFVNMVVPAMLQAQVQHSVDHPRELRSGRAFFKPLLTFTPCTVMRVRCVLYVVLGVLLMVIGSVVAVMDIVRIIGDRDNNQHHSGKG